MRYFRIKYGFNPADFVSIEEKEIERAIAAQVLGIPIQLGDSYINGRNIISITPHWHRHTSWAPFYEPKDADDFAQIKRDCPNYDGILEKYKDRVQYLLQHGMKDKIGKAEPISEFDKPKESEVSAEVKALANKMKLK